MCGEILSGKSSFVDLIIPKGADIKRTITEFVLQQGWKDVFIVNAIGSAIDMVITTPVENTLPLRTTSTPIWGAAELLSMSGEIMPREKMDEELKCVYPDKTSPLFVHIHVCFATAGGHVAGGGLKSGKAFRALRVLMLPL